MEITKDIKYVGVNDHQVDLFEGQYVVPNGVSYNSYVILDEKVAVMDTVDARRGEEWLANLEQALKSNISKNVLPSISGSSFLLLPSKYFIIWATSRRMTPL